MNDDELLRALKELPRETEPPPELEERIVARLYPRRTRFFAIAAAIAICAFLGGYAVAGSQSEPTHILFVHQQQIPVTSEQMRARVAEYGAWARNLQGGERLTSHVWLLEGSRVENATPTINGYFLMRASDDTDALRIARTCPHLRYGGRVELRRIAR